MDLGLTDIAAVIREIGFSGFVDIAVVALVLHAILVWLKRTRRAAAVLGGLLIVAAVYLVARQFEMRLTAAILQGFFAVILIALVVIFQEELRYLLERIARFSLLGPKQWTAKRPEAPIDRRAALLAKTAGDLARERRGAILALCGRDSIARHVEGGTPLNGDLSEAVLQSLFDPHSIGHDGAVILEGNLIRRFGSHLPLSRNLEALGGGGTRHAAALGLTERVDALCIVVSEETGTMSITRHGAIRALAGQEELVRAIREFYEETEAVAKRRSRAWFANAKEGTIALLLSVALWFVLVHEARVVYRTYRVPVAFGQTPPDSTVAGWDPTEVEVTFSAPRTSFYFTGKRDIRMAVKVWDIETGTSTLSLNAADFDFPRGLAFENVRPRAVEVRLTEDAP